MTREMIGRVWNGASKTYEQEMQVFQEASWVFQLVSSAVIF